jgi:hypothetical protein
MRKNEFLFLNSRYLISLLFIPISIMSTAVENISEHKSWNWDYLDKCDLKKNYELILDDINDKPVDSSPHIYAKLGSIDADILLDSGANDSIIGMDLFNKIKGLNPRLKLKKAKYSAVYGVGGGSIKVHGHCMLDVFLGGNLQKSVEFTVLKHCDPTLGCKFLDLGALQKGAFIIDGKIIKTHPRYIPSLTLMGQNYSHFDWRGYTTFLASCGTIAFAALLRCKKH